MTSDLLNKYGTDVKELALVPSGGGCFEITFNGNFISSKLDTGEFPTTGQITSAIEAQ